MVKNLWETQVHSLGREDPLEKGMTTHSSIPAWRIPWTEEPGGLKSMGLQTVGHGWGTNTLTFTLLTSVEYSQIMKSEKNWKNPEGLQTDTLHVWKQMAP